MATANYVTQNTKRNNAHKSIAQHNSAPNMSLLCLMNHSPNSRLGKLCNGKKIRTKENAIKNIISKQKREFTSSNIAMYALALLSAEDNQKQQLINSATGKYVRSFLHDSEPRTLLQQSNTAKLKNTRSNNDKKYASQGTATRTQSFEKSNASTHQYGQRGTSVMERNLNKINNSSNNSIKNSIINRIVKQGAWSYTDRPPPPPQPRPTNQQLLISPENYLKGNNLELKKRTYELLRSKQRLSKSNISKRYNINISNSFWNSSIVRDAFLHRVFIEMIKNTTNEIKNFDTYYKKLKNTFDNSNKNTFENMRAKYSLNFYTNRGEISKEKSKSIKDYFRWIYDQACVISMGKRKLFNKHINPNELMIIENIKQEYNIKDDSVMKFAVRYLVIEKLKENPEVNLNKFKKETFPEFISLEQQSVLENVKDNIIKLGYFKESNERAHVVRQLRKGFIPEMKFVKRSTPKTVNKANIIGGTRVGRQRKTRRSA